MRRLIIVLAVLGSMLACTEKRVNVVSLENTTDIDRTDEAFVLTRSQLMPLQDGLVPVLTDGNGEYIPCQLDDLDKDGQWDELAFVYTLTANEKTDLNIKWIAQADYPKFTPCTNIRYGKMAEPGKIVELESDWHGKDNLARGEGYPYQMDGVAWENDKMGFRHYFDGRNCRDVFGKRVLDMVLDTVGIKPDGCPGDTYHVLADWGRDIMSAANSFGLGGLAILSQDSLIRLGVTIDELTDNVDSTFYKLVTEGPVRSVFKLDFYGWQVRNSKIDVYETVTIWAGKYGYENLIETSALPDKSALVTGIVRNFNDNELVEKNIENKITVMMTHDKQTYNKEWYMGMALTIPAENLLETFDTPNQGTGIIATWCAKLKPGSNGKYKFNTYAAWELQDERFTQSDFFFKMVTDEASKAISPVKVGLK